MMVVESIFTESGFKPLSISLGEVILSETPTESAMNELDQKLENVGFERIDEKKTQTIERIKNAVVRRIHHADIPEQKYNWSVILAEELKYDYNYLSGLFSSVEGVTIEQYIIQQKIERVKELLLYDELTLSEIAYQLGYSSVQHLSGQFRKITGATPTEFKKIRDRNALRKPLDSI